MKTLRENAHLALIFLFWSVIFFGSAFTLYEWLFKPEPQPVIPTLAERCDFVKATTEGALTFDEPNAGVYNYELYMRSDGYVEVWKCPPKQ